MQTRRLFASFAAIITIGLATSAHAQSPSADIDPGRLGFGGSMGAHAIIDPQPLHVDRINMNSIDPQAIRMDNFHFKNIDPGKAYQANVAPQWMESRALTMPGLGIQKLDPGRLSLFKEDPGTLEPGRLRVDGPVFNPIDPGRLNVDPIEKTRIDPGALSRQGTEYRTRVSGSTVFLSAPVSRVGGPTPRDSSVRQNDRASDNGDPRFMPLKW